MSMGGGSGRWLLVRCRQILIEDPAGNPVEAFEPSLPEAHLNDHSRMALTAVRDRDVTAGSTLVSLRKGIGLR